MAKIISVCNRKGGVGKTATAVNLSAYLAALGKRVLLVDIDPQSNASSGVGIVSENLKYSVYHSLIGQAHPGDIIRKTRIFGLDILPSSFDLAGATIEMVQIEGREFVLLNMLDKIRLAYDYLIIDCPPSLELLTINGLVAADEVIIPVQCEYYSLQGLNQLMQAINLIQQNLQSDLKIGGVLLTMYDRKIDLGRQVKKEVKRNFSGYIYKTIIPKDVKLAEAPSFGKTILQHDYKSNGARAYFKLAKEIINLE